MTVYVTPSISAPVARVTFTVELSACETVSTDALVMKALQYVARSVIEKNLDVRAASQESNWRVEIQSGLF